MDEFGLGIEQRKRTELDKKVRASALTVFIFAGMTVLIFILMVFRGDEDRMQYLIFGGLMGVFTKIAVIALIISVAKRKKQKKQFAEMRELRLQQNPEERLGKLIKETDDLIEESRRERLSGRRGKKSITLIEERRLLVGKYKGEIQNKTCAICKLELRKKQKILQCKECLSLFHQEHLEAWLEKNELCPVCNKTLVDTVDIKQIE